jgi:hypothetical protein
MHSNKFIFLTEDSTDNCSSEPLIYTSNHEIAGYASCNIGNLFAAIHCRLAVSPLNLNKQKARHSKWPQMQEPLKQFPSLATVSRGDPSIRPLLYTVT